MSRALMIASVASMIRQFNMNNISLLRQLGFEVDVACNFQQGSNMDDAANQELRSELTASGVRCFQIDFSRFPFALTEHYKAYQQVEQLLKENQYAVVHCHAPITSVLLRLAARRTMTPVIYTAHGFQFFHGGSLKDWVLYYPIEKFLSKYTDTLITINSQDYSLAKDNFQMTHLYHTNGVGVDLSLFSTMREHRQNSRAMLGLSQDEMCLISVGELNKNKNHNVVLDALARIKTSKSVKYFIVGRGQEKNALLRRIEQLGLKDSVHLLGYRNDVGVLLSAADIFVFPSLREGLGLACIEAMATGLPVIASSIGGITEYVVAGVNGFLCNPRNPNEFSDAIDTLCENPALRETMGKDAMESVKPYDTKEVIEQMRSIYDKFIGGSVFNDLDTKR